MKIFLKYLEYRKMGAAKKRYMNARIAPIKAHIDLKKDVARKAGLLKGLQKARAFDLAAARKISRKALVAKKARKFTEADVDALMEKNSGLMDDLSGMQKEIDNIYKFT